MKYIITESQYNKAYLLRRLHTVDDMINNELHKFTGSYYLNICEYDLSDFFTMVIQWVAERMYYDYFGDMDDDSEEWSEIHNIIVKYIESVHPETIKDFYYKTCPAD